VTDLPSILDLLELEYVEENLYRSRALYDAPWGMYGGQAAAQALYAAGLTVDKDRLPHSLHGYFVRRGDSLRPTLFRVDRDRDGRSFSARRVVAVQDGEVIFSLSASFAVPVGTVDAVGTVGTVGTDGTVDAVATVGTVGTASSGGPARQPPDRDSGPVPDLPDRDPLRPWTHPKHPSFEFRRLDPAERLPSRFWIRCTTELPDDPLIHAAVLAYTSDISSGLIPFETGGTVTGPSLDHAVWFHRPARVDGWIWQHLTPGTLAGGRGWYTGSIHAADGSRIASFAQEQLFSATHSQTAGQTA
jgi:acyl-CoA thioesterase II